MQAAPRLTHGVSAPAIRPCAAQLGEPITDLLLLIFALTQAAGA